MNVKYLFVALVASLCFGSLLAQNSIVEVQTCQPWTSAKGTVSLEDLEEYGLLQNQPGSGARQACGVSITSNVLSFTATCNIATAPVIFGPFPCSAVFSMSSTELDRWCSDQAITDESPTMPGGSCLSEQRAICARVDCAAPTCGQCPRNPSRTCTASSARSNAITYASNSQNFWDGSVVRLVDNQCNIRCKPKKANYDLDVECRCQTSCSPCP